jgi:16S rRNA (guanine527-N7)-methyltransferase
MNSDRIAHLLEPFLRTASEESAVLSHAQLAAISIYIDLLLRWNAHLNLTAVRQPEQIVTRHFGESFFLARHLFPALDQAGTGLPAGRSPAGTHLIDVGSGAGFPGLPIKIWAPYIQLTLIESNQKKATFLREVSRALKLTDVEIFAGRAGEFPAQASTVTLRAVERFAFVLKTAASLVAPEGRLAILVGEAQASRVRDLAPEFNWAEPIRMPLSLSRVMIIGSK